VLRSSSNMAPTRLVRERQNALEKLAVYHPRMTHIAFSGVKGPRLTRTVVHGCSKAKLQQMCNTALMPEFGVGTLV